MDENCNELLKVAFDSIQELKQCVINYPGNPILFKDIMFPLQGADLWQKWAKKNKELNRQTERGSVELVMYSKQIEDEKDEIRKKQLELIPTISELMNLFLNTLLKFSSECSKSRRNYFLQHLNLFLDEHYRQYMSTRQQQYVKLQKDMAISTSECTNKDAEKINIEYMSVQQEILQTTFGIEHIFREIGQIYEAACTDVVHKNFCSQLSNMMADLVIDGYPLELMDGDAAHVPLQWINAVLTDVSKKLNDPNIFVLSVLGIRSSGKSTLLNAVFGLKFKVSAGRCTRGAFMQLIQFKFSKEPDSRYCYIFIIDSEGLRAPEVDNTDKYKHDNELATFVIGLANTTLINIMGQVAGDMDDTLQTSVHAFLRMTRVENRRSCQFVFQNTSASIKSDVSHTKFTQKLDKFTKDAAEAENCASKYEYFDDVIQYNDFKDTHNFPVLWKGGPPMAPVNEEYSEKAQLLKYHIIKRISEPDTFYGLQGLSLFITRFNSLWDALLHEDFVFSFKNTLQITAYNALTKNYIHWDFIFKVCMKESLQTVANQINGCSSDDLFATVLKTKQELQTWIGKKHMELKETMDLFFKGKYHEIIIHWKKDFEVKLNRLADSLQEEAEDHCKELAQT